MFTSLTSKVVTAVCALIGAIAFFGIFFLAVTGGSPYVQFGLALVFFAMFIVGSYTKYVCIMAHYAKDYKARTAPSL
jgi:hypothetical protein